METSTKHRFSDVYGTKVLETSSGNNIKFKIMGFFVYKHVNKMKALSMDSQPTETKHIYRCAIPS